jgi:hypothetical protein
MPAEAADHLDDPLRAPLLERLSPGKIEEIGVPGLGDQLQPHAGHEVRAS